MNGYVIWILGIYSMSHVVNSITSITPPLIVYLNMDALCCFKFNDINEY